jgi:hypothetical protein
MSNAAPSLASGTDAGLDPGADKDECWSADGVEARAKP